MTREKTQLSRTCDCSFGKEYGGTYRLHRHNLNPHGEDTRFTLFASDLANIPQVKVLVESNRQLREQIDLFHEADKLAVMEPELGDYCSVILDSEELAQTEALADAALKPFKDVVYE